MTGKGSDSLDTLEQRRLQLERQVAELDKLLAHWRSWETDYEILREEISSLPSGSSIPDPDVMITALKPSVLDRKELQNLLNDEKGAGRSSQQILDLLRHRIEYVCRNVDTVTKSRDAADEKLRGIHVLIHPDLQDEEGLPLTEITEELDDDGNVLSSSARTPNDEASGLFRKLEGQSAVPRTRPLGSSGTSRTSSLADQSGRPRAAVSQASANARAEILAASLQQDVEVDESDDKAEVSTELATAQFLDRIAEVRQGDEWGMGPTLVKKRVSEPSRPAKKVLPGNATGAVIPNDESPEDAALRREMLEYSMNEVGAVVAEMNLENDESDLDEHDDDDNDDSDDGYDYDEDDDEDDEDQFGRSKRSMIDEDYRQEMLALEKRLNVKALENLGPAPGRISPESEDEPKTQMEAKQTQDHPILASSVAGTSKKRTARAAKSVRFANNLDVTQASTSPLQPVLNETPISALSGASMKNPLADQVQERKPRQGGFVAQSRMGSRKTSRFKAARTPEPAALSSVKAGVQATAHAPLPDDIVRNLKPVSAARAKKFAGPLLSLTEEKPRFVPEGPEGRTHANVVERAPDEVPDVDMNDNPGPSRAELASEYYKQRNKLIYEQGGFTADDPESIPLDENGVEIRPKVSRFKAARLGRTSK